jgi:hypothetical protein
VETVVLNRANSTILVSFASSLNRDEVDCAGLQWKIARSNPMIQWIGGNFVEGDKANSNGQFWTAGDLELAEYTIRYAPLNMVHEWKQPVGFFADTRTVKLDRHLAVAGSEPAGSMKIQVLAGLWQHIFPREAALVENANQAGLLALSMECVGTHLRCTGPNGCGKEFAYNAVDTHCEHLHDRSSIRHIVNPVFRGGALIVPPAKPGWKGATAGVIDPEIMKEAAAFAEYTEQHYEAANATSDVTTTEWEALMAMVIQAHA